MSKVIKMIAEFPDGSTKLIEKPIYSEELAKAAKSLKGKPITLDWGPTVGKIIDVEVVEG